jgi:DNA-binding NarL/FixJ family response regulator
MTTTKPLLSILCIDDHAIVRHGIRALIRSQTDMAVIADATSGEEGVRLFRELRPDITLMDLQLPGMSDFEAIQLIRQENGSAKVIVPTMYQGSEDIHRAHEAGAVSYVIKETLSDDLVSTIRAVHGGREPLHEQGVFKRRNFVSRRMRVTHAWLWQGQKSSLWL